MLKAETTHRGRFSLRKSGQSYFFLVLILNSQ